jgi:hypothetical protein
MEYWNGGQKNKIPKPIIPSFQGLLFISILGMRESQGAKAACFTPLQKSDKGP